MFEAMTDGRSEQLGAEGRVGRRVLAVLAVLAVGMGAPGDDTSGQVGK